MRLLVMILLPAVACSANSVPSSEPEPGGRPRFSDQDVIMLYRSPCSAGCPVYEVRVTAGP